MEIIWQKKSNNKRLILKVKNGKVYVSSPYYATKKEVESFVKKSSSWIEQQLEKDKECLLKEGNTIRILEHEYQLVLSNSFHTKGNILYFTHNEQEWKYFLKFYECEIYSRFIIWTEKMGLNNVELRFGFYQSKFGSCQKGKRIIKLNYYLALCTYEQIDAVIVHELCHLKYDNHSKAFYDEVLRWYPKYYEVFNQLKDFKFYRAE